MFQLAYILILLGVFIGIGTIYSVYVAVRKQHQTARNRFRLQTGDWSYWYWTDLVEDSYLLNRTRQKVTRYRSSVFDMLPFAFMARHRKQLERLRIHPPAIED